VVFWVVTPCRLVGGYQRLGGTCFPQYQGRSLCDPEDGSNMFFRSICVYLKGYMASQHRRPQSEQSPPWMSENLWINSCWYIFDIQPTLTRAVYGSWQFLQMEAEVIQVSLECHSAIWNSIRCLLSIPWIDSMSFHFLYWNEFLCVTDRRNGTKRGVGQGDGEHFYTSSC
jgi:hypothetical protein